jgi:citrate lyase subunit beta/citryl-CoA lyase
MQRRRTMLFCPASNPKMLYTAHLYEPDCILFDLEDAVSYSDKIAARDLLVEALKVVDYRNVEIFARINPLYTEFGEQDVRELVEAGLKRLRLPMCESKENIEELDKLLTDAEKKLGIKEGAVKIQGAIETPKGAFNAHEIAKASPRMISISFGAEDFTRELGVSRTAEGKELLYGRTQVVMAAKLAGIDPIDTVWTNLEDHEGFLKEALDAKILGFTGKSCIHPKQISQIHQIFSPTQKEIESAIKIIKACQEQGLLKEGGVILVDGKMVDGPVIRKAEHILKMANIEINEIGEAL